MKIGVYVGSFNPVHKGHIKIVNHLLNGYLDKIIMIPTLSYWDKNNLISLDDRINMLKYYENDNIIIDCEHNSYMYTYMILDSLSKRYSDISLIIGADNIIKFNEWKNYEELLKYNLIILNRDNIDINEYINKYNIVNYKIVNDLNNIDISSTKIREFINNGCYNSVNELIDEEILNYIINNNLYKEDI